MTRPAADVINAIIANLVMARQAATGRSVSTGDESIRLISVGETIAYSQAIGLIRVEAMDILEAKP